MMGLIGQAGSGVDLGSLGAGAAFGAGVFFASEWFLRWRRNGLTPDGPAHGRELTEMRERYEREHDRVLDAVAKLGETQQAMAARIEHVAARVEILVDKMCHGAPATRGRRGENG